MPQGPDGNTIIIIKKVSGHGGAHGGAWKVAYADFVTSMMALFMVLWLISASTESERELIAEYFRQPGLFSFGGGRSPIQMQEQGLLEKKQAEDQQNIKKDKTQEESFVDEHILAPKMEYSPEQIQAAQTQAFQEAAQRINESIAQSKIDNNGVLENIEVKIDAQGMHIDIMDSKKISMFELGRDILLPEAQAALVVVAMLIKDLPNPIDIEGHTDSTKFVKSISNRYDNWYLASDRANIARKVFLQAGIQPERIHRIVGYADTQPKDVENLSSPSNRRITITLSYDKQAGIQKLENLKAENVTKINDLPANNIVLEVNQNTKSIPSILDETFLTETSSANSFEDFR
ncbi:MAG: OmpA family protein [Deltaproteobacteria bacterium]|jgi:chemotaxis protein MotB|nr:OmpA family protein [Deltaproteobacteria bacterium]